MVATAPRILPPGYLSIDGALDRIDPGLLSDVGTDEERRQFDKFVSLGKWPTDKDGNVLAPPAIQEEFVRRARRRAAFKRICDLCAYGTVPSALLLDDFTVRAGVPSIFWLDERLSATMRQTGRAPVTKPRDQYAVDGPTGWVMVEAAAFACLLAAADVSPSPKPTTDLMRDDWRGVGRLEQESASDPRLARVHKCVLHAVDLELIKRFQRGASIPGCGGRNESEIAADSPGLACPTSSYAGWLDSEGKLLSWQQVAARNDDSTILRGTRDGAFAAVSNTSRTVGAPATKRPFSHQDAMSLLVAKKSFGPWANPPIESDSLNFLEGEFDRVPREAHRAMRKEIWGSLIRKGPPAKAAK